METLDLTDDFANQLIDRIAQDLQVDVEKDDKVWAQLWDVGKCKCGQWGVYRSEKLRRYLCGGCMAVVKQDVRSKYEGAPGLKELLEDLERSERIELSLAVAHVLMEE